MLITAITTPNSTLAKIHLRKIIKYPENKISENTKSRRETMSKFLRTSLESEKKQTKATEECI